jgi:hypothetical protein
MNPCEFLYNLSTKTNAKFLVITVPYLKKSRVGLHHIRQNCDRDNFAENTHILELSPKDWNLLVKHSGWGIIQEKIYLQYPKKSILRLTKSLWKNYDFEGFYGMVLSKNHKWSSKYMDW